MAGAGPVFDPAQDKVRLAHQTDRVRAAMQGGQWRTLQEIAEETGDPQSSVSAQLRHFRKAHYGGYLVEKRRRVEGFGTWEYRVSAPGGGHE